MSCALAGMRQAWNMYLNAALHRGVRGSRRPIISQGSDPEHTFLRYSPTARRMVAPRITPRDLQVPSSAVGGWDDGRVPSSASWKKYDTCGTTGSRTWRYPHVFHHSCNHDVFCDVLFSYRDCNRVCSLAA